VLESINNPAYRKSLTPAKALQGTAIGNYIDIESGTLVVAHIIRCVSEIMTHFNVPAMTAAQVTGVVDVLMEKHPDWSVEDFTVFSKTIRMGNVNGLEYPKSFHRIDPDMLVQFASIYNLAKVEAREQAIAKEKSDRILADKKETISPELKEKLPSLVPFMDKLSEMSRERKAEFHGSGNGEKMREQFQTDEAPVKKIDNTESMKKMIDSQIAQFGKDHVRAQISEFKKAYHAGMNDELKLHYPFPEWVNYATERLN